MTARPSGELEAQELTETAGKFPHTEINLCFSKNCQASRRRGTCRRSDLLSLLLSPNTQDFSLSPMPYDIFVTQFTLPIPNNATISPTKKSGLADNGKFT